MFQEEFITSVESCGGDVESLKSKLKEYIDEYITKKEDAEPTESVAFKQIIYRAGLQAQSSGRNIISLDYIINAIYTLEDSYASYYMQEEGINLRDLLFALCHDTEKSEQEDNIGQNEREKEGKSSKKSESSILKKYTVNLTALSKEKKRDPLIGREDILNRTIQVLCRRTKNNPIHVGEPGVGKTAITMGLARLIAEEKVPEKLKDAEIFAMDIGSILAGTKYRGDFEERIKRYWKK